MGEAVLVLVVVVLMVAVWGAMNVFLYQRIYGRPLQLRYLWAVHGLLLFGKRERNWERR